MIKNQRHTHEGETMDIITSALIGALGKVGGQAVQDGYAGLKDLLLRKFGEKSDLADAVTKLEQKPESEARKGMVAEEVEASEADKDQEILAVAKQLLEQLNGGQSQGNVFIHQGSGEQNIAQGVGAIGKQVHTGSGDIVGRDKIVRG
jgi:hypothetical protein